MVGEESAREVRVWAHGGCREQGDDRCCQVFEAAGDDGLACGLAGWDGHFLHLFTLSINEGDLVDEEMGE